MVTIYSSSPPDHPQPYFRPPQQSPAMRLPFTPIIQLLHVATVNVRYDGRASSPVPIPETGAIPPSSSKHSDPYAELPWAERRSRLVDTILGTGDVDVIGFQEVLKNQLEDLQTLLGPSYAHVGVGRDDGQTKGEYSPIFYDSDKFEQVDWDTIWLSPTPGRVGSKGWDAHLPRIATFLTLKAKQSKEMFHVINTHYDDAGIMARAESSWLIRKYGHDYVQNVYRNKWEDPSAPTILLGDFNSPPEEAGYKIMTSSARAPGGAATVSFMDAFTHLSTRSSDRSGESQPYGFMETYSGFKKPGDRSATRIDFIMLAKDEKKESVGKGDWEVSRFGVVDNWIEGGVDRWTGRWSDHRLVRATLKRVDG